MALPNEHLEQGKQIFDDLLADADATVFTCVFSERIKITSWHIIDRTRGKLKAMLEEQVHIPAMSGFPVERHTVTVTRMPYTTCEEQSFDLLQGTPESLTEFSGLVDSIREASGLPAQAA